MAAVGERQGLPSWKTQTKWQSYIIKSLPKMNFFPSYFYILFRNCIVMYFKNKLILGCMLIASISCFMLFWDATIKWMHTQHSFTPLTSYNLISDFQHAIGKYLLSVICYPACVTCHGTVHKHVNTTWIRSKKKKKKLKRDSESFLSYSSVRSWSAHFKWSQL